MRLYSSRSRGKWKDLPHILRLSPLGWLKKQEVLSIEYEEKQDLPEPVQNKCSRKAWARLIAKVYKVDPLVCPVCKSEMKVVAGIIDPTGVKKILLHPEGIRQGSAWCWLGYIRKCLIILMILKVYCYRLLEKWFTVNIIVMN